MCNNAGDMKSQSYFCRLGLLTFALLLSTVACVAQSSTPAASPLTPSSNAEQAPAPKADGAGELVKQAEDLNSEGKFDEALALYQRALQLSPKLYRAQLYMGVTLDLQGKYQEARQHLAKAIELASDEETTQALRVMAVSYAFERNTDKASEYERRAFDLQYNWQKYEDAAATANELARIYLESGDLDNAFQWYQTGKLTGLRKPNISQAEKDLWTFRWEAALARIDARRGKREDALKHLAAAKALLDAGDNPDQFHFYPYLAGYVALYTGDYNSAIKELQKADQKDPFVLSLEAQTYEKLGDKAQAWEYYERVMAINLHNPSNAFARPLAREKLAGQSPASAAQKPQ
jgi:tetratricopeptide (TPR) repeat protein